MDVFRFIGGSESESEDEVEVESEEEYGIEYSEDPVPSQTASMSIAEALRIIKSKDYDKNAWMCIWKEVSVKLLCFGQRCSTRTAFLTPFRSAV